MAIFSGPEIPNDGLVFNLDAANPKNYALNAVEVLVVAGGGAGSQDYAGGGGGGGVVYNKNFTVTPGTAYNVTVADGGARPTSSATQGAGTTAQGSNSFIGPNLVSNGTFSNTSGWSTNGSGSTTYSAVGGRLSVTRNGGLGSGEPYTTITVESGVVYTMSVDVGGTPMGINIGSTIGGTQHFGQNIPTGSNNVLTFTATSSGTAYVLAICDNSGTTSTIDNLFIGRSSSSLVAVGGGAGGGSASTNNAGNGGSGGGAGGGRTAGTATSGQGNAGAVAVNSTSMGGGGGGAGGAGNVSGAGGVGIPHAISGTSTFYGGGGGGTDASNTAAPGGTGGGGTNGGFQATSNNGVANTGGGGSAHYGSWGGAGNGGSGIVIVRYPGPQRAIGGTVTKVGNDIVHTFTATGSSTFTPISTTTLSGMSDLTNNNFSTNNGSVTYSSSNNGTLVFSGSNYLSIPNSDSLNITSALTIEAWVKFDIDSNDFIFEKGDVNTQYSLFSHSDDIVFRTYHAADGTYHSQTRLKADIGVVNGQWVHLVASWDGANKRIYVNGVLKDTASKSGALATTTKGASVGRFGGDTPGYFFNGNISKVAVYNRGLTSTEVLNCFNASRDRYGI